MAILLHHLFAWQYTETLGELRCVLLFILLQQPARRKRRSVSNEVDDQVR